MRLLVAEARAEGPPARLVEDRQVTRLGASVFETGRISEESMAGVCGVLRRMQDAWRRFDVTAIRCVATSATRDASNQAQFVERASAAIGAPVETISGQEEARLIHLGVESVWPHPRQRVLIVDVGGGSAELIAAENGEWIEGLSRPLGAVRLTGAFLGFDPPTPTMILRLEEFIDQKLALPLERLGGRKYDRCIATSASASAVVCAVNRVARAKRDTADRLRATTPQIRKLYRALSRMDLAERRKVPGLGPRRAEIIVPGAAVFLRVLEHFQLPALHYCSAGVRDGIIADLAARGAGQERARLGREERRTVEALARRYGVPLVHARQVAAHARTLFESLLTLHRLKPEAGRMLEAAAILCDVGHFVSDIGHHKHSQYVVMNSDLPGFTDHERTLVAMLCRYHRKSMPVARHADFQELDEGSRQTILRLIPLLRLADALDRTREQRVSAIRCEAGENQVTLRLTGSEDLSLEQWATERAAVSFREVYLLPVTVVRENRGAAA